MVSGANEDGIEPFGIHLVGADTDAPQKRAVGRRPNADYRKREHLTETEIEKLIEAAKTNRHGHRDATMICAAPAEAADCAAHEERERELHSLSLVRRGCAALLL